MFEEDEQEDGTKRLTADDEEVLDLLQMLLNFRDNDAGTGLHYATKVSHWPIVLFHHIILYSTLYKLLCIGGHEPATIQF